LIKKYSTKIFKLFVVLDSAQVARFLDLIATDRATIERKYKRSMKRSAGRVEATA
jgi:hypothetical protein